MNVKIPGHRGFQQWNSLCIKVLYIEESVIFPLRPHPNPNPQHWPPAPSARRQNNLIRLRPAHPLRYGPSPPKRMVHLPVLRHNISFELFVRYLAP